MYQIQAMTDLPHRVKYKKSNKNHFMSVIIAKDHFRVMIFKWVSSASVFFNKINHYRWFLTSLTCNVFWWINTMWQGFFHSLWLFFKKGSLYVVPLTGCWLVQPVPPSALYMFLYIVSMFWTKTLKLLAWVYCCQCIARPLLAISRGSQCIVYRIKLYCGFLEKSHSSMIFLLKNFKWH